PGSSGASALKILVFLEHHEGKLQKDSLGVLGKAASLGGEAEAVLLGEGVEGLLRRARQGGAARRRGGDGPARRGRRGPRSRCGQVRRLAHSRRRRRPPRS